MFGTNTYLIWLALCIGLPLVALMTGAACAILVLGYGAPLDLIPYKAQPN